MFPRGKAMYAPVVSTEKRLWNLSFTLLVQGQVVSAIGDVFYRTALGFWILAETGSSALMGTVMAASIVPAALLGPFAGVVVDRTNRKWMIVAMDGARSAPIIVIAVMAFLGQLELWMVFAGSIFVGAGDAFFRPAVMSSIPDIVPQRDLLRANSAFGAIDPIAGVVANALAGIIYAAFGAPVMFLVNGVSYLLSALSEIPIRIPHHVRDREREPGAFWKELREGFDFVRTNRAVRLLFLNVGTLNFFLTMGGVLMLPYFDASPQFGPVTYGTTMALMTAGAIAGLVVLSIVRIPAHRRFTVFAVCSVAFAFARAFVLQFEVLPAIFAFAIVAGVTVSIINSFIGTIMQTIVPAAVRGKVFALLGTSATALIPLGMATGGILAEWFPVRSILPVTGAVVLAGFVRLFVNGDFRRFIANDGPDEGVAPDHGAAADSPVVESAALDPTSPVDPTPTPDG